MADYFSEKEALEELATTLLGGKLYNKALINSETWRALKRRRLLTVTNFKSGRYASSALVFVFFLMKDRTRVSLRDGVAKL